MAARREPDAIADRSNCFGGEPATWRMTVSEKHMSVVLACETASSAAEWRRDWQVDGALLAREVHPRAGQMPQTAAKAGCGAARAPSRTTLFRAENAA